MLASHTKGFTHGAIPPTLHMPSVRRYLKIGFFRPEYIFDMVLLKLTFFGYHREEEKPMGLGASVAGTEQECVCLLGLPFLFL